MMGVHLHPISGRAVYGEKLSAGDVIKEGDVYDSTSGKWELTPCAGAIIQKGSQSFLVRPAYRKMTKEEDLAQRRSFAFGNAVIGNPLITREMVDEAVGDIEKSKK